jgi:hypothetical protein
VAIPLLTREVNLLQALGLWGEGTVKVWRYLAGRF